MFGINVYRIPSVLHCTGMNTGKTGSSDRILRVFDRATYRMAILVHHDHLLHQPYLADALETVIDRYNVLVGERFRLIDRSVAPAIFRIVRHTTVLQQKPNTLVVSLRTGQMQCRSAIVIRQRNVHAGQLVTAQRSDVTDRSGKQWKLNTSTSSLQNCTPRQLLPSGSSGGDHMNMPITFGMTSITPPHTPDLAGRPTLNAN
uniref:Uncharacterized protein n=1 Tax=Anopheles coluzzii TaxID=1518534 RepID=A0A8W7PA68_ANOCL